MGGEGAVTPSLVPITPHTLLPGGLGQKTQTLSRSLRMGQTRLGP